MCEHWEVYILYATYMFWLKFPLTVLSIYFPTVFTCFVLPFIPLPFSFSAAPLSLSFLFKNMKMKTVVRFSVRFRLLSSLVQTDF
jgi:hypothetical protein